MGAKVNVGCGTITCNYDGYVKSRTVIEDGAFIGSDTQLVAPVTVGAGAVTAAGTTVYRDVPAGALALTRPEIVFVEGWAERKRQRMTGGAKAASNGKSSGDAKAAGGGKANGRPTNGATAKARHARNFPKPKTKQKKAPTARANRRAAAVDIRRRSVIND